MDRTTAIALPCIFGLSLVETPAFADPILLSAGADRVSAIYIIFGNIVVALLESWVITKVFGTTFKKTFLVDVGSKLLLYHRRILGD